MLQNLLEKILDKYNNKELAIQYICKIGKNKYIYPSKFKEYTNYSDKVTYEVLNLLYEKNILRMKFILYCPYCDEQISISNTYGELIKYNYCGDCDREFNPLEHAIVVYEVRI